MFVGSDASIAPRSLNLLFSAGVVSVVDDAIVLPVFVEAHAATRTLVFAVEPVICI